MAILGAIGAGLARFSASHASTLIMTGALLLGGAGAVWYYTEQAEARGELEAENKRLEQTNQDWQVTYDKHLQKLELLDKLDADLETFRQEQGRQRRQLDRELEDLRNAVSEVDAYLSMRAPPEFVDLMCKRGVIAPEACPENPGQVSD